MRHICTTVTQERFNPKPSTAFLTPFRLRNWFGVLAVFLGLIAQTVHTHPGPRVVSVSTSGHAVLTASVQSPEVCPLCVAMHSSNPARPISTAVSFDVLTVLLGGTRERFVSRPPAFIHFSR